MNFKVDYENYEKLRNYKHWITPQFDDRKKIVRNSRTTSEIGEVGNLKFIGFLENLRQNHPHVSQSVYMRRVPYAI